MDESCAPVAGEFSLVELGLGVDRVLRQFDVFGPGLGVDFEACLFFFAVELGLGAERKTHLFSSGFGAGLGDNGDGDGSAVELGLGGAGLGDDGDGGGSAWTELACPSIFCFKFSTFFLAWSRSVEVEGSISALEMDSVLASASASFPLDFRSLSGVVGLTSSAFTSVAGFFSRRESCPVEPEVVFFPAQEGEQ
jgi:hypothetical protein